MQYRSISITLFISSLHIHCFILNHFSILLLLVNCFIGYPSAAQGFVHPTSILAEPGETVTFICVFEGEVQWKFGDRSPPYNMNPTYKSPQHKLMISDIREENHGQYICEGKTATNVRFQEIVWLLVKSNFIEGCIEQHTVNNTEVSSHPGDL